MNSIILILDNIRSTHNVGSILRTADGFGVSAVYMCGYTPYPATTDDPRLPHERDKITRAIHKTALGAEASVPIKIFSTTNQAIVVAKRQSYQIACLEQSTNSTPLAGFAVPKKLAIVLGNELTGVASDTLKISDFTLEIPMVGTKESFNVSIAAAICLYELNRNNTNAAV